MSTLMVSLLAATLDTFTTVLLFLYAASFL